MPHAPTHLAATWWPWPDTILWFLGAFLTGWGISLVVRGWEGRDTRRGRRCPACAKPMQPDDGLACSACKNTAASERDLFIRRTKWRMAAPGLIVVVLGLFSVVAGFIVRDWIFERDLEESWHPAHALAAGLSLFALAFLAWALVGDRSRGRRRCPKCWYDLRTDSTTCPECGHSPKTSVGFYRARRRWTSAIAAFSLLLAAAATTLYPRVETRGWATLVPSWLLVETFEYWPDSFVSSSANSATDSDTLEDRTDSEGFSARLRARLNTRARRCCVSATTPLALRRAMQFADPADVEAAQASYNHLIAWISSPDHALRKEAIEQFHVTTFQQVDSHALRTSPTQVPGLLAALEDPDADVRSLAASFIGSAGAHAEAAIPRLLEILPTGRLGVDFGAAWGLAMMCKESSAARDAVFHLLDEPTVPMMQAVASISRIAKHDDPRIHRRLMDLLQDDDDLLSSGAARALCRMRANTEEVLAEIFKFAFTSRSQRAAALDSLYSFELALQPYLPELVALADDPDTSVRIAAIRALSSLSYAKGANLSAALPTIDRLAEHPDDQIREAAQSAKTDIRRNSELDAALDKAPNSPD